MVSNENIIRSIEEKQKNEREWKLQKEVKRVREKVVEMEDT